MKRIVVFILLATLAFNSCDQEVGEEALFIAKTSTLNLTIVDNASKSVTFSTRNLWFTDCGAFHHVEKQVSGNEIKVTVFGSQLKNAFCNEDFSEFNSRFTISTEEAGTYIFRFWKTETATLDTTITVLD